MSGSVEVSLADCKRVGQLLEKNWGDNPTAAVMAVIRAYNAYMNADPVGTVRRSPEGTELAIAVGFHEWWLHELNRPQESPRRIKHDPVIPSWPVVVSSGFVLLQEDQ